MPHSRPLPQTMAGPGASGEGTPSAELADSSPRPVPSGAPSALASAPAPALPAAGGAPSSHSDGSAPAAPLHGGSQHPRHSGWPQQQLLFRAHQLASQHSPPVLPRSPYLSGWSPLSLGGNSYLEGQPALSAQCPASQKTTPRKQLPRHHLCPHRCHLPSPLQPPSQHSCRRSPPLFTTTAATQPL